MEIFCSLIRRNRALTLCVCLFFMSQVASAQNQQCFGDCRGLVGYNLKDVQIMSVGIQENGRGAFLNTTLSVDRRMLNHGMRGAWGSSVDAFLLSLRQQGYTTVHLVSYTMGGWCISGARNERIEQENQRRIAENQARYRQQQQRQTEIPADDWPKPGSRQNTYRTGGNTSTSTPSREDGDPALLDIIINSDKSLQIYGFNLDGKFLMRKYGLDLVEYGTPIRLLRTTNSLGGNIYTTNLEGKCAYPTEPNFGTGIEYTVFRIHESNKKTNLARNIYVGNCH